MKKHGRRVAHGSAFEEAADDASCDCHNRAQRGNSAERHKSESEQKTSSDCFHFEIIGRPQTRRRESSSIKGVGLGSMVGHLPARGDDSCSYFGRAKEARLFDINMVVLGVPKELVRFLAAFSANGAEWFDFVAHGIVF